MPRALARKRLERSLGVPVAERTLAGWPIRYVVIGRLAVYTDHALDAFAEQRKRTAVACIGHAWRVQLCPD